MTTEYFYGSGVSAIVALSVLTILAVWIQVVIYRAYQYAKAKESVKFTSPPQQMTVYSTEKGVIQQC